MQRAELPGGRAPLAERVEQLEAAALEDHDLGLAAVADKEKALRGIGRERRAGGRCAVAAVGGLALSSDEDLRDIGAVESEDLNALAPSIRDVDRAVLRDASRVNRLHELRGAVRIAIGGCRVGRIIGWRLSER